MCCEGKRASDTLPDGTIITGKIIEHTTWEAQGLRRDLRVALGQPVCGDEIHVFDASTNTHMTGPKETFQIED